MAKITNTLLDPHTLGQFNSACTVSNGYMGLKGNIAEDRDGYSPVTLINGVYDELDMFSLIRASNEERRYLDETKFDAAGKSPAVANLPDPLFVRLFVDNEEVTLSSGKITDFRQTLDLEIGEYSYTFVHEDQKQRRTRVAMSRFASYVHCHNAFMRYAVTPMNHSAPIRILSGIDGTTFSNTTREKQYKITQRSVEGPTCYVEAVTPARQHTVAMSVGNKVLSNTQHSIASCIEQNRVYNVCEFKPTVDEPILLDRAITLASSEDERLECEIEMQQQAGSAYAECYESARELHEAHWRKSNVVSIAGDEQAETYLRFCTQHLESSAPHHTDKLTIPVKLLTGEYYQGNTFYDTDLYITPYFTFTNPEVAKKMLNFRWLGLTEGRKIAQKFGCAGAKFAWQAGPYGEECLGDWWMFTHTNIHIDPDVAYELMQYYWATGDDEFMNEKGVDLLVETARFLASRVSYDEARDAYDLHKITGPDEGHVGVTNDFYTCHLSRHNLRWAAETLQRLQADFPDAYNLAVARLQIDNAEPTNWLRIADRIPLLFDEKTKVYEQCEGFYQLKELPPKLDRERDTWFETVSPYQALNQPDVLMSFVLFRDEFTEDVTKANWEFYKDKSMNFSSMSFVLNAIMAADMGEMDLAYENFIISAGEDIDEELTGRKDTFAGLHGTASGGAWMAAIFGFAGVHVSEVGLRINPNLPPRWNSMNFKIVYQGVELDITLTQTDITIQTGENAKPINLNVAGKSITIEGNARTTHTYC